MKLVWGMVLVAAMSAAQADEEEALTTKAVRALQPAAEAYSNAVEQRMLEGMAAGKGEMGAAARRLLEQRKRQELIDNRGTRKPMRECIKPEGLIDQDVKDCMDGLIAKDW